jgi:hypothetical protein
VLLLESRKVLDGHAVDPRRAFVSLHAFPRFGEVLTPLRSVRAGWLRILRDAAIAALRALRIKDFLDHGSFLRGSMLPSVTAIKFASPSGVVGWLVRGGVEPLLIGSVLHRLRPPVSSFERASHPRLIFPTTITSADFSPPDSGEI